MECNYQSSNVSNETEGPHDSTPTAKNQPSQAAKHRSSPLEAFIRPIIALTWQFVMLTLLITFVVRTESTANPIVPKDLATLYEQYPQTTSAAITIIGSLLSVSSTQAFAEAVRFAIVVSLKNPVLKSISLYSLCASTSVGSQRPLFDRRHVRWMVVSLILLLLFTVQTTAWTTILTPRTTKISYQTSFVDFNYTNMPYGYYYFGAEASDSGIAAARERFNTTTYLSLYGNVFNGTSSRGITPITDKFNNWTRVEAIQQGFTADVNCAVTQAVSDPVFRVNQTTIASVITRIYLCCNCTSINTEGEGYPIYILPTSNYIAFTVCPISNADNIITVYMITEDGTRNLTCTIKPLWLNVNVTYDRDGYITLDPSAQLLPDIPLNTSMIIQSVTQVISFHFLESQTVYENAIQNILTLLGAEMLNVNGSTDSTQVIKLQTDILAEYIRGVVEYAATMARYYQLNLNPSIPEFVLPPQPFPSTTYVNAIVWGQDSRLRLLLVVSPLTVMVATIAIIVASFYRARHLDLDRRIASFDIMDTMHIVVACSSGNMHTVLFPDYSENLDLFSKDLGVKLIEGAPGSRAAGFHASLR